MTNRCYQVLEEYDPKKHNVKLRPSVLKCITLLKKGDTFEPKNLIVENADYLASKNAKSKLVASKHVVDNTLKIAKELGIIKEPESIGLSFEDFCQLDTVQYFSEQLKGTKTKYLKSVSYDSSTKRNYLYRTWEFNNWLHGKTFEFKQTKHLTETQFEIVTEKITIEGLEHFLELFKRSFNSDSDFIRVIKRFLNDEMNRKCSVGYMKMKRNAILSYFEKNECELKFKYDPRINHQDFSEESSNATLSLTDLYAMITSGGITTKEKAVILCKFHRGLDNSTFCDRFNFQAWDQLVEYFGTENYDNWDISKCPVPIRLTRIKTNYTHVGYLDVDAIQALQKWFKVRFSKTGENMKSNQPIFIGRFNQPIRVQWLTSLIPRLAENAGIQKKINNSNLTVKNEKTSHELRDLLKSTLIVNGVASYVCELAIGHKVGDSYEKQDKLYPDKSRAEFMKASEHINIFSNYTNYLKEGNELKEKEKQVKELEAKLSKFVDLESRFDEKMRLIESRIDSKMIDIRTVEEHAKEDELEIRRIEKEKGIIYNMTTDQARFKHDELVGKLEKNKK
ncbi:hypothetical protein [Nitrosopumilus sp. S4]